MALTRKLFYISIFTSNYFRTQTHKEREREITDTLLHTELTHIKLHPLPHAKCSRSSLSRSIENFHSRQKISLFIHSHHSRQAQAEGWRELLPVKPRSSPLPMAPSIWSCRSNPSPIWSHRLSSSIVLKPISDEPSLIVLAIASAVRSHLRCAISPSPSLRDLPSRSNPVTSLSSSSSQFDRIWLIFFFLGFVSFVFLCLEMILYICLEAEKMWATSRKCVFYCIFKNTTKH